MPKSSTPKDDHVRLRHIRDAAARAAQLVQGRRREALDEDDVLAMALIHLLEIVGEAAAQVSPATRARFPSIPWRQATSMRHKLIHGYADVELDIVWKTLLEDLPPLLKAIEAAMQELGVED